MTSENTRNADAAQQWLDRAAKSLEAVAEGRVDLTDSEYISAAAAVGFGYSQLAHLDAQRAERAEDLAAFEARRAEDLARVADADRRLWEHYAAVERANSSMDELAQAQLAVVERRDAQVLDKRDELIAAAQARIERAKAEARPHDGEPVNLRETDADAARRFAGQVGDLTCLIDDALSWIDDPKGATPEQQLAKIRECLEGSGKADRG